MKYSGTQIIILASDEYNELKRTVEIVADMSESQLIKEINILLSPKASDLCKSMSLQLMNESSKNVTVKAVQQETASIPKAIYDIMEKSDSSHLLLMCADGETDPTLVRGLTDKAKMHPNSLISASRWLEGGGFEGYGKLNRVLNYLFQKIFSALYRTNVTDATFGFFITPKTLVEKYRFGEDGFSGYIEFLIKCIKDGVDIIQIPAKWIARNEGKSSNSFFEKLKYARISVIMRIRR